MKCEYCQTESKERDKRGNCIACGAPIPEVPTSYPSYSVSVVAPPVRGWYSDIVNWNPSSTGYILNSNERWTHTVSYYSDGTA